MTTSAARIGILATVLSFSSSVSADSKKYFILNGFAGEHNQQDELASIDSRAGYFFAKNIAPTLQYQSQVELTWNSLSTDELIIDKAWLGVALDKYGELRLGRHDNAVDMITHSSDILYLANHSLVDHAANDEVEGLHYIGRKGPYGLMLSAEQDNQNALALSFHSQDVYVAAGIQDADEAGARAKRISAKRYFGQHKTFKPLAASNTSLPALKLRPHSIGISHSSYADAASTQAKAQVKQHTDLNLKLRQADYFAHLQLRTSKMRGNETKESFGVELGKSISAHSKVFIHHSNDNGDDSSQMSGAGLRISF